MGNPHQLTRRAAPPARHVKSLKRTVMYGAGTLSMLVISMVTSLSLWIALPWLFLGWSPTLVTSGSMQPLVAPGDVVMVRPVRTADLTPNTVVLFQSPTRGRMLHRIVEQVSETTFRTQGDANAVPDSEILDADTVRGAAVLAVPWVGRPSLWLAQGRIPEVAATGVALLVILWLAPRSFDPAYDPWSSGRRVNPAEVLLGRSGGSPADRRGAAGRRLLPEALHGVVLDRLAVQTAAAQRRTVSLVEGLS